MDAEIKAEWVAALRSGEYKQGQEFLAYAHDDGSVEYCCLGVLCEILATRGMLEVDRGVNTLYYTNPAASSEYDSEVALGRSNALLPKGVADMIGMNIDEGQSKISPSVIVNDDYHDDEYVELTQLNDGEHGRDPRSFNEIADLIEESEL